MRIEQTNALTLEQIKAIGELEKAAFKKYSLENHAFLSNEINFDKRVPSFYMGYEGERLVAFLTFFIPSKQEAEISAVTHPDFQRKGCFTALFAAAQKTLHRINISRVLFVLEPRSKSGLATLKTLVGSTFERSEYRMSLSSTDKLSSYEPLQFFEVDNSNKELFSEVLHQVHTDMEDADNYALAVVNSNTRKGYIAYRETPVGVFNLNFEDGDAFLYGVGIAEKYRGNGLGKKLTGYAVTQGLKRAPRVVLDVNSDNPVAFHIYQQCGFQIDFQVDYYSLNII
ncbi:MAG: GNAT family N-acetyltransferase [Angelakisella sp.]